MLTLTEAATRKIGEVLTVQTAPVFGLRVSVQPGGFSGYQYGMSLAPAKDDGDWVGEYGGFKVVIDPESAVYLEGAHIDYVESLQGSGFSITNPNAARGCGCGKSFETESSARATAAPAHGGCGCGGGGCGCAGH